ncbi:MAG: hypothetical protein ACI4SF_05005 [Oscillospiraceae bacterium]
MMYTAEQLIKRVNEKNEPEKREALMKLCELRCSEADAFFADKLENKDFLPYLFCCRSDAVSDYAAERLDIMADKLLSGEKVSSEELLTVINLIIFKESDRLMEVLGKIGENYSELKDVEADFFEVLSFSEDDFIRSRCTEEIDCGCETKLFKALNDVLICTTLFSEDNFSEKVMALYEKCPEAYRSAGFFVCFIEDNYSAYDRFAANINSPDDIPPLLSVLNGLSYKAGEGVYVEFGPQWFRGPKNEKWHSFRVLGNQIDCRWADFLTEKVPIEALKLYFNTEDEFSCCRMYSDLLTFIVNPKDKTTEKYCGYFRMMAGKYTSPADMKGLELCQGISGHEQEIIFSIVDSITAGTNCYKSIYRAFTYFVMPRRKKSALIESVVNYVRQHETDPNRAFGRNEFFYQAELFLKYGKGYFDR